MSNNSIANPAPLGLWGFATTTWLLSMINAGFFSSANLGVVLAMAFAFGGAAQVVAGILEFLKGNSFGGIAFSSYGFFWLSWGLYSQFFKTPEVEIVFVGWYLVVWGVFTLVMCIASLAKVKALAAIFISLTITFFVLAIGDLTANKSITHIGGYFGLLTAILAAYLAAAETINESFGKEILPLG